MAAPYGEYNMEQSIYIVRLWYNILIMASLEYDYRSDFAATSRELEELVQHSAYFADHGSLTWGGKNSVFYGLDPNDGVPVVSYDGAPVFREMASGNEIRTFASKELPTLDPLKLDSIQFTYIALSKRIENALSAEEDVYLEGLNIITYNKNELLRKSPVLSISVEKEQDGRFGSFVMRNNGGSSEFGPLMSQECYDLRSIAISMAGLRELKAQKNLNEQ